MTSFTSQDLERLEKTTKAKERLMDVIFGVTDEELKSVTKSASGLTAVTNLLESIDRGVVSKAKIISDDDANKNQEQTNEVLKALMIDLHKNKNAPLPNVEASTNPSVQPPRFESRGTAIMPGELIPLSDNVVPPEDSGG